MIKRVFLLVLALTLFLSTTVVASSAGADYFKLFNEHGSVMLIIDPTNGNIVFSNRAAQNFYGYSKEALEAMTIQQINTLSPEEVAAERERAAREERNHFVFRHRLASGKVKTVEVYSYPVEFAGSRMLFSIINDITPSVLLEQQNEQMQRRFNETLLIMIGLLLLLSVHFYRMYKVSQTRHKRLIESERRHSTLVANIPGMVYKCKFDEHWTMEYVSEGSHGVTGYAPAELVDNAVVSFESIIDESFRAYLRGKWDLVAKQGTLFSEDYPILMKDGSKKWVAERGQFVYAADGQVEGIEGVITDIDALKLSEEKSREYYEKLHATLVSVGDGVITTDREGKIELLNPVAHGITGWSQREARGQDFKSVFRIINEHTRETTKCPVEQVFETGAIVELENHTLIIARDGTETAIEDTAAPIHDLSGHLVGAVVVFRDSTDKRAKKREIEYISYHDFLTGLYNRRFFENEVQRLDYERNYPISIILLDVNGLKIVNDAFGHAAGDELIQKVATVLTEECRSDEIVARYGGDEFAILLPRTSVQDAEKIAHRLKQRIEAEKVWDLAISISVGWETKATAGKDMGQVINDAENYMYQKKIVENRSKRSLVIKSILNTLLVKSPREEEHAKRVSYYCEQIGLAYGMGSDEVKSLTGAGELHDIGKIAIDDHVLNKEGQLTAEEWRAIRKHPDIGYRILSTASEFEPMAEAIVSHHERWDGTGYPKGLKGEEIVFSARVVAVADAYDAMISERPYRPALTEQQAVQEMIKNAGTQFDPEIVKVFLKKVIKCDETLYKNAD